MNMSNDAVISIEFIDFDGTKKAVDFSNGEISIIEVYTDCIDDILSDLTPEQLEQVKNGQLVICNPVCSTKN